MFNVTINWHVQQQYITRVVLDDTVRKMNNSCSSIIIWSHLNILRSYHCRYINTYGQNWRGLKYTPTVSEVFVCGHTCCDYVLPLFIKHPNNISRDFDPNKIFVNWAIIKKRAGKIRCEDTVLSHRNVRRSSFPANSWLASAGQNRSSCLCFRCHFQTAFDTLWTSK